MPTTTYEVIFHTLEGDEETYEYNTESAAHDHMKLFGADDADMYNKITLREYDWTTRQERVIEEVTL